MVPAKGIKKGPVLGPSLRVKIGRFHPALTYLTFRYLIFFYFEFARSGQSRLF